MIKSAGIDFVNIHPEKSDEPLGLSSGAGTIFGVTGGVMEAAIRTAYELYTGETLVDIEVGDIRGFKGVKEGQDHDGRQGAAGGRRTRLGQRPSTYGDGPQGPQPVPVRRDHGLSRRLHRRRRPALRRGQLHSAR